MAKAMTNTPIKDRLNRLDVDLQLDFTDDIAECMELRLKVLEKEMLNRSRRKTDYGTYLQRQ
jgi:hypothetical protein